MAKLAGNYYHFSGDLQQSTDIFFLKLTIRMAGLGLSIEAEMILPCKQTRTACLWVFSKNVPDLLD